MGTLETTGKIPRLDASSSGPPGTPAGTSALGNILLSIQYHNQSCLLHLSRAPPAASATVLRVRSAVPGLHPAVSRDALSHTPAVKLATEHNFTTVYMTGRSQEKADAAAKKAEAEAGKEGVFKGVAFASGDSTLSEAAGNAIIATGDKLDYVLLNAGGNVVKEAPLVEGFEQCLSKNVVGHHILMAVLVKGNALAEAAIVVASGSEAMAGVMGMKRPNLTALAAAAGKTPEEIVTDVAESTTLLSSSFNAGNAYAGAKFFLAMWVAAAARRVPGVKWYCVSPGGTRGTNGTSELNPIMRFVFQRIVGPLMLKTVDQSLRQRYLRPLTFESDPPSHGTESGLNLQSKKGVTGTVVAVPQNKDDEFYTESLQDATLAMLEAKTGFSL